MERDLSKTRKRRLNAPSTSSAIGDEFDETTETDKFIGESTLTVISEVLTVDSDGNPTKPVKVEMKPEVILGLKPNLEALCEISEKEQAQLSSNKNATEVVVDLNLEGLDDDEIEGYILTEAEAVLKDRLWNKMNAEYLKIAKEREERAAREREEGKPEKKKRRSRKKQIGPSSSALEALQKVLQEKKISSKIDYDILRSLTKTAPETETATAIDETSDVKPVMEESLMPRPGTSRKSQFNFSNNRRSKVQAIGFPMASAADDEVKDQAITDTGKFIVIELRNRIIINNLFSSLQKITLKLTSMMQWTQTMSLTTSQLLKSQIVSAIFSTMATKTSIQEQKNIFKAFKRIQFTELVNILAHLVRIKTS